MTFTVSLSNSSVSNVSVNYATANGTAIAGSDYTAKSSSLTFTPGQTTKTLTVVSLADTIYEAAETMFVNLSSPSG